MQAVKRFVYVLLTGRRFLHLKYDSVKPRQKTACILSLIVNQTYFKSLLKQPYQK